MAALHQVWEMRDPAQARDYGLALLQWCRVHGGRDEVTAARYWMRTATTAAVLIQFEEGRWPEPPQDPEVAKALYALMSLAHNSLSETWIDARAASDTLTRGGGG